MKTEGVAGRTLQESADGIAAIEAGILTLDEFLDTRAAPESRRITGHLLLCYFRRKRAILSRVRSYCIKGAPRPEVQTLLCAAFARLFFQTAVPREKTVSVAVDLAKNYHADRFVNAVLRRALREEAPFPDTPGEVLPPEIFERWSRRFSPQELQQLTACFLAEAPFCCRSSDGMPDIPGAEKVASFGKTCFFSAPAAKVFASPAFAAGRLYIQDPAASFAVSLVEPENVRSAADLCAAPGGKALLLAEMLPETAQLFLFDASEKRQRLTRQNFALRGKKAEIAVARAQDVKGTFDLVVADVPCSNTGVFRRRPDALWRFSPKALDEIVLLQKEILFHAATLVSSGGQLLYSTCSIEEEENTFLVQEFEAAHPAFRRLRGGIILPDGTHDGAGAFLWRKEG